MAQKLVPESTSAATDVGEFFTDLDGGMFDHKLSIALSRVAAAVIDHDKAGEVVIKLNFKRIAGTHQVLMKGRRNEYSGQQFERVSRLGV